MLDYNEFYLTLIRHGQSTTNQNPDLMGQEAETPLSDRGRLQAQALHDRFEKEQEYFDFIYSSHYTRAFDTASIVKGPTSQPIILSEDLREYSAGDWTNASRSETITMPVVARMGVLTHCFLPPNGESLNQVERRASKWLEETILYNKEMIDLAVWKKANEQRPINIACFSHGMTIKCLLHYIMGFDKSFTWKVTIENTSISKLYFGKEGWRLLSINDHAHLSTLWTPRKL